MGAHLIDGEFQSDKYPTCPRGKVPLSVKDTTAQDLLWEYAQRRRSVDAEFSADLEAALHAAGYEGPGRGQRSEVEEYVRREPDADERGTLGCRHPKPCRVTGFAPPGAHPGGHLRESCDNCGSWRLVSPGGAIGSWQRPLLMLRGGG